KLSENKNGIDIICDSVIISNEKQGDVIASSTTPVSKDCKTSMFVPNVPAVYTSTSNLPSDLSSIISLNLFAYKSCTSSCPSSCANFNVIVSPSEPPSPFPSSSPSPSAPESPHATKAIDKINMNTIRKILLFFNTLFPPLF